ncbi:hypothetical protein [Domibacillus robiginosus]|uniref:hypothetical protein n=1 Tax=Domibacillus robiginosus TaxID=1071054 RepID=UPI00067D66D4|nr:hypothetical protein [Domibacillus robiginosus]
MNKPAFISAFLHFLLNGLLIFAGLLLLLPFLAPSVHHVHPVLYSHFYFYHYELYTIVISVLLAALLSYRLYKRTFTPKAQIAFVGFQLIALIFLATIVSFNIDYLNTMLSRPTYE